MTEPREYRLRRGITLAAASVFGGLSLFRASIIERDPAAARPGELELLRAGVDRAVEERDAGARNER